MELQVDYKSRKSYEKIGRIYNAVKCYSHKVFIERLLKTEGDINCKIPIGREVFPNILFFAKSMELDILVLLLDHGVNFTIKNRKGRTIVHELIRTENDDLLRLGSTYKNEFVDAILSAHIKFNVFSNPCDKNGISHFHAACIINNAQAVEFFLKNGVAIDQAVNADSSIFPSDTPLHLSVKYACTEVAEILLKYGANTFLKNANELTPTHVLIDMCIKDSTVKVLPQYEKMLDVFFKFAVKDLNDINVSDEYGFCKFHAACLLQDYSTVKSVIERVVDVNRSVNSNSPVCPGYTPLHFSASSNVRIFKLLLSKGANIKVKNVRGKTPFDLCLQNYISKDIRSIIFMKNEWKNIVLSDNKTRLLDVISTMENTEEFISFFNRTKSASTIFISFDSPLWPGYTLLHLAIVFTDEIPVAATYHRQAYNNLKKVIECVKRGADMAQTDAKGSTALHLAFYLKKRHVVDYLLDHDETLVNLVDGNNLSHFHIACAASHLQAVESFFSKGVNVNIPVLSTFEWHVEHERSGGDQISRRFFICPGSTALHINVASGCLEITKKLLALGADIQAKDVNGFTPVHRLLTSSAVKFYEGIADLLLSTKDLTNQVTNTGLSHLHVACFFGHLKAIKMLLRSGANVNALVSYRQYHDQEFDRYANPADAPFLYQSDYAPIHFACLNGHDAANLLLVNGGVNIFLKADEDFSFLSYLSNHPHRHYNAIRMLNKSATLRGIFEHEFGLTKLHLACCAMDRSMVKKLIRRGANVNARVRSDSPIWQGYTPLHVVTMTAFAKLDEKIVLYKLRQIIRSLVKYGADMTLMDSNYDTPLHLYLTRRQFFTDHPLSKVLSFFSFLFEHLKNFNVNPTNSQGLSLFHIACIRQNAFVIEKMLKQGVDVNQTVSYFSDFCPGSTPLHMVIEYYHFLNDTLSKHDSSDETFLRIVDVLLDNGANVNAMDSFGDTPLIKGVRVTTMFRILIQRLIRNGANVHATNVRGHTAFELLLKRKDSSWEEIELFLKLGCQLDAYNPVTQEGYLAKVFRSHWTEKNKILHNQFLLKIIDNPCITEINHLGRTAIHNVISIRDSIRGNSMTYYADLVKQLINRGCDIDHQDNEGKTALHLAENFANKAGIIGLLKNGANVSLTDRDGKTFFSRVCGSPGLRNEFWTDPRDVMVALAIHVYKLELCGLRVNELNKQLILEKVEKCYTLGDEAINSFRDEIEQIKDMKIGTTLLLLYEYLMSKDTDMYMTSDECWELDKFFEEAAKYNFLES